MKKQLTLLTLSIFCAVGKIAAQNYTPIATTGYTVDAIAEYTPATSSTDGSIDGGNTVSTNILYSQAYGSLYNATTPYGLPNSGIISAGTKTFQLQPYNAKNLLYIPTTMMDTLTFVSPAPCTSLSVLGFCTEGGLTSQMSFTVRFTDNTSQVITGLSLGDWFNGTTNVMLQGFNRANRSTGTPDAGTAPNNPRMYSVDFGIACANQGKFVKRIVIKNGGTGARICILGLAAVAPPYSATASNLTPCGATSNVTVSATGLSTYTWEPMAGFAGSNSQTIVVSPTITTTYTLDGSSASGCPASTLITIFGSVGVPTISFANSSPTVCLGSNTSVLANGAATYTLSNSLANGATFTLASTTTVTVTGGNGCGTSTAAVTITVNPLPIALVATNTLVCASSPATITANSTATSYSWQPGVGTNSTFIVSPAATTVYTVSGVAAGNCRGTNTISINTKANPTLTITANSATICNGATANLAVAGTATNYLWSNGQTGLSISVSPSASTFYTATGTGSNNCTSVTSQVVIVNPNPTITATSADAIVCVGGITILSVSGASTYVWDNSTTGSTNTVTVNANTIYSVTGTNVYSCSTTTTVAVAVNAAVVSVSSNTSTCLGVNVPISASGADTYTWNTGSQSSGINVSPSANTVYTVNATVTDLNTGLSCNASNTVAVSVNPNPTITAGSNRANNAICRNETAILTGSGAGANGTYTWTGGSGAVFNATTSVAPIANQTYTITGMDGNGCKSIGTIMITVSGCTGIQANTSNMASLVIYPNPNNGEFTISSDQVIQLNITNQLGQHVGTLNLDGTATDVKVNNLSNGVYFITGQNANGSVKQKIVIAK